MYLLVYCMFSVIIHKLIVFTAGENLGCVDTAIIWVPIGTGALSLREKRPQRKAENSTPFSVVVIHRSLPRVQTVTASLINLCIITLNVQNTKRYSHKQIINTTKIEDGPAPKSEVRKFPNYYWMRCGGNPFYFWQNPKEISQNINVGYKQLWRFNFPAALLFSGMFGNLHSEARKPSGL